MGADEEDVLLTRVLADMKSNTANNQTLDMQAANTISNKQKLKNMISLEAVTVAADNSVPVAL